MIFFKGEGVSLKPILPVVHLKKSSIIANLLPHHLRELPSGLPDGLPLKWPPLRVLQEGFSVLP